MPAKLSYREIPLSPNLVARHQSSTFSLISSELAFNSGACITFRFAASPNVTGLTVGDITGIDKNGWEYLWVRYEDAEDTLAKVLVKKPVAAYVEKVYEEGDFAGLGIGS